MRRWTVRIIAVVALGALLALSRGPVAAVRAQTPPANRVPYPVQLTLAPGDAVTLYDANPTALPGAPADVPFALGDPSVAVTNSTPDPLDVSSDGTTLTLGETAGAAVQLQQRVVHISTTTTISIPGGTEVITSGSGSVISVSGSGPADNSPIHLIGCGASDPSAASVSCTIPDGFSGPDVLAVTATVASGAQRTAGLQPGERATLLLPASSGDAPAIDVANNTREPLQAAWDGTTLTATIADGYSLDGSLSTADTPRVRQSATATGCAASPGPNVLACPLTGLPAADISLQATLLLPTQALSLPYSDGAGAGTLSVNSNGLDSAGGGEPVIAVLSRGGATFSGSGVLRPWQDTGDIRLTLTLNGSDGSQLLLEGALYEQNGAFGGRGYTLAPDGTPAEDWWQAGTLKPPLSDFLFIDGLAVDLLRPITDPSDGSGLMGLPQLADENARGALTPPAYAATIASLEAGSVGQPLDLRASFEAPDLPIPAGTPYTIDFGDGSAPVTVGSETRGGMTLPVSLPVEHTYTQPGDYTVIVYLDGEFVGRLFGAATLHITAAAN